MIRSIARRFPFLHPWLPAALIACGSSGCTRGEAPLVAFLGDSLTAGWSLREEEAFPARVSQALAARGRPIRVLNAGRSGDTVAQALSRLPRVLQRKPDVLVVALGINDALRGQPLEPAEAALRRIVAEGRAAGARVLLVGFRVPRSLQDRQLRAFEAMYPRVAAGEHLPLVPDLLEGVSGRRELLFRDGLHPNAAGQERLALNVQRPLELLLAELEAARR